MRTALAPLPERRFRATPHPASRPRAVAALAAALALGGGTHAGPRTVTVDRFDDASAIGESLKQQTLLNVVELRCLGLPADQERFVLTYSPVRGADGELAVCRRSMLQEMGAFATYLEVPEAHLKDHSVVPQAASASPRDGAPQVRIRSGKENPGSSFAALRYRDHGFWIDDGDLAAKRAITAIMFFFTLADTGETGRLPVVTIPAQ